MIQRTVEVPVFILEASDLDGFTDQARARGKLEAMRAELEEQIQAELDRDVSVTVGFETIPRRGRQAYLKISGLKMRPGEAIAFFPTGPAKIDVPEEKPKPAKKAAKKRSAKSTEGDDGRSEEEEADA